MGHEGEGKHRLGKCWELKWADVAVLFRYCFFIFLFFCCDCFIGGCPCRAVKSGWAGLAIGTGTLYGRTVPFHQVMAVGWHTRVSPQGTCTLVADCGFAQKMTTKKIRDR